MGIGGENEKRCVMIDRLIEMYQDGAITGCQVMMDCLHGLDRDNPNFVVSRLPEEILEEMLEYTRRYDPTGMHSIAGLPPAAGQVRAAQGCVEKKTWQKAERQMAS